MKNTHYRGDGVSKTDGLGRRSGATAGQHAHDMSEKAWSATDKAIDATVKRKDKNKLSGPLRLKEAQTHAKAGEAHLEAAREQSIHGRTRIAAQHLEKAAEHAETAGSEWDESKHPRGPDGKFT